MSNSRRILTILAVVCAVFGLPSIASAQFVIRADSYSATNGVVTTDASTGVLANDKAAAGSSLTASLATSPAHGVIAFNSDGSFIYATLPGFVGVDTFTYTGISGTRSATATVTITTNLIATDDNYATSGSSTLTVAAPGLLTNDLSVSGTLTVAIESSPTGDGQVTVNSTGAFTYVPGPSFVDNPVDGFEGSDSFTYRVTSSTGATAVGTVTITDSFSIVHRFVTSPASADVYPLSSNPFGNLVRGPDNKLYGTTNGSGCFEDDKPADGGNVFRIESDGALTILKSFTAPAALKTNGCVAVPTAVDPTNPTFFPGDQGSYPTALMRASDGNLYGTTEAGGDYNEGTIYRLVFAPTGDPTFQSLHSFNCHSGEGLDAFGALVEGPDGMLYGTNGVTVSDFTGCWGSTAFNMAKDGSSFRVLASFGGADPSVGFYMLGPLLIDADGTVYGTSRFTNGSGSVFRIRPGAGAAEAIHQFDPSTGEGALPSTGLIRGLDGALYGTAEYDSITGLVGDTFQSNPGGTIFRLTPDGSDFRVLYHFNLATDAIWEPMAPLRRGGDGRLYGGSISGGRFGGDGYGGGIYEFDLPAQFGGPASDTPTSQAPYGGQLIVLDEFDPNNDGDTPEAQLGVGADHHIYGTMSSSGPDGGGAVFGPLDVIVANNPPQTVLTYTGTDPVSHATVRSPNPLEATSRNGAAVTLSSLSTTDEDFDPLTFRWAQTAAPDFVFSTTTPTLGVAISTATGTFPIGTSQVTLIANDGQPHVISPFIPDLRTATTNVAVKHTLPPVVTTSGEHHRGGRPRRSGGGDVHRLGE